MAKNQKPNNQAEKMYGGSDSPSGSPSSTIQTPKPQYASDSELSVRKVTTKRQRYEVIRAQLENERSSFLTHWRDLGEWILPRRPRFFVSDVNKGDRRNQKIIDSTATLASRTLRSGMMAGITSPSRPWFRLTTTDQDIAEYASVKDWLYIVEQRMATIFLQSNLYKILPIVYGDVGTFATAAMLIEEDFQDVVRFREFPVGSFTIACDYRGRANTFFREFRMTVQQVIEQFGMDENGQIDFSNISETVKNMWLNNQDQEWVDICHIIMPNTDYNPRMLAAKYKRFISCYYEKGFIGETVYAQSVDGDKMLRESGYDLFPVLSPRWEITGEDVYGTQCPGMESLGDVKALQLMHKRKAQSIEKLVNPPMKGPSSLKTSKASILPGDITYIDEREGQQGFKPVYQVDPKIQEMLLDIRDHQVRIKRAFYEDLFLMLAQSDRRIITAREIEERHEEKLLAIGPVLEQLNQDLLDPLIDLTFEFMLRQGRIPPPPEELQGQKLKVEYISVMAQAMKLVGISSIERFAGFVIDMATKTSNAAVLDKIDIDQIVDEYGISTGVPPKVIRTDEQVAVIRQQRAQAAAAQQQADAIKTGSESLKNLSQSETSGDNALTELMKLSKAGEVVPQ